ncbi:hypothetical protein PUNSTDRAFT_130580 [Punctularia strigosozonata HHB-11173 SS5]|uniref:uncharacterized protein n=1 Tax=Punctularia strigosozonata (strain HHB-11173) TaxID=741275 RepID=UPI00044168B1|nr:uncharacterized protein PUNSTDRAFT_130580 [Punctularia strigosozonata HHB-11173 SS5]EIN12321.1 hypothetical protein PUNSTDRAFT_130580 [Punctularia strigosozonata HHB-11173 SS5]
MAKGQRKSLSHVRRNPLAAGPPESPTGTATTTNGAGNTPATSGNEDSAMDVDSGGNMTNSPPPDDTTPLAATPRITVAIVGASKTIPPDTDTAGSQHSKRPLIEEDSPPAEVNKSRALARETPKQGAIETPQTPQRHGGRQPPADSATTPGSITPLRFTRTAASNATAAPEDPFAPALAQGNPQGPGAPVTPNHTSNAPVAHASVPAVPGQRPAFTANAGARPGLAAFSRLRSALAIGNESRSPGSFAAATVDIEHTPAPLGGWPEIHTEHATRAFDGLDEEQAEQWLSMEGTQATASIFDLNTDDCEEVLQYGRELEAVLRAATGLTELMISVPVRKAAPLDTNGNPTKRPWYEGIPHNFLIYNVPPATIDHLVEQRIWALRGLAFEVRMLDKSFPPPRFVQSISGFMIQGTALAKDAVIVTLKRNKAAIADLCGEVHNDDFDWAFEGLLDSVHIDQIDAKDGGGRVAPRYNVFADIAILLPDNMGTEDERDPHTLWFRIRNFMRHLSYTSLMNGSAINKIPFTCGYCHGIGHPKGMCPFPEIPGWNGPQTRRGNQEEWPQRDYDGKWAGPRGASRARGRGRGRGHGRF